MMSNGKSNHHHDHHKSETPVAVATKRIYLWTIPRSISTAFERCFLALNNAHVDHEPYCTAYFFGPDSNHRSLAPFLPTESAYSYQSVKDRLQMDYPGKDIVFCKDHAFSLGGRYEMLATGFIHTILIRDPVKTMSSFHRVASKSTLLGWSINTILPDGLAYKALYNLEEYVRTKLSQNVIIIDADDLVRYPEQMIRRYCDAVGIPFELEMLDWDSSTVNLTKSWSRTLRLLQFLGGIYDRALTSTSFSKDKADRKEDMSCLPDDVIEAIKVCQPYYDELYEKRIIPEDRETEV